MGRVYKLLGRGEWAAAEAAGVFTGSSIDLADGYIHLSSAAQVAQTARLYFSGRDDVLLLEIEADLLGDALKWEPSRGGDLFPHLFSNLAIDQVIAVRPAPQGADGAPILGGLTP